MLRLKYVKIKMASSDGFEFVSVELEIATSSIAYHHPLNGAGI
jgi:hypothetical protein